LNYKPREYAYAGKLEEATRLGMQAKAYEKIIEKDLGFLHLKPNMKALDAACGTGAVTRRMAVKARADLRLATLQQKPLLPFLSDFYEHSKVHSRDSLVHLGSTYLFWDRFE